MMMTNTETQVAYGVPEVGRIKCAEEVVAIWAESVLVWFLTRHLK